MSLPTSMFRSAIGFLKTISDLKSYQFRKTFDLAVSYESSGDRANAIRFYRECLRIRPDRELYRNVSYLYFEMNEFSRAIEYLGKASFEPEVCMVRVSAI